MFSYLRWLSAVTYVVEHKQTLQDHKFQSVAQRSTVWCMFLELMVGFALVSSCTPPEVYREYCSVNWNVVTVLANDDVGGLKWCVNQITPLKYICPIFIIHFHSKRFQCTILWKKIWGISCRIWLQVTHLKHWCPFFIKDSHSNRSQVASWFDLNLHDLVISRWNTINNWQVDLQSLLIIIIRWLPCIVWASIFKDNVVNCVCVWWWYQVGYIKVNSFLLVLAHCTQQQLTWLHISVRQEPKNYFCSASVVFQTR